jgi:magnesium transporter
MIKYIHRASKTHMRILNEYVNGSWVYVENPSLQEIEDLVKKFGLDGGHVSDALDQDEVPRLEREGDKLYLYTRFPYVNGELHLETVPILFVLSKDSLITISTRQLPRFTKFTESKLAFKTTSPDQLLLIILNEIFEQYDSFLNQIGRQIKVIRSGLRAQDISNKDFIEFVLVEDELNEFLSALTPTNAILQRVLINKHIKMTDSDKDLIEDLLLANAQSIEAAKSSNKSIINIREAYSTIMTNSLNRVIRILTVATVLLSILTVVAGLYGMNVKLPLGDYEHAFSIIAGLSVAIIVTLLALFKKNRWL